MANTQCTSCGAAASDTDLERAHPFARWYKHPHCADITIKYGKDGEKKFVGHRLILCSASEWFMRASKNFREASEQEILLTGDNPEGLEALFEYAYMIFYTESVEHPNQLTLLQNQFQHRLHVFATADKYQAEGLASAAYRQLKNSVDLYTEPRQTSDPEDATTAPKFFRFMLRQVYENSDRYFSALCDSSQQSEQEARGASLPASHSASPTTSSVTVSQRHTPTLETTSDPPTPLSTEDRSSSHPIDRVRDLLVEGAAKAWVNGHPDFNRKHLVPLAQVFPDFGTDLIVAALKATAIQGAPECLDEDLEWMSPGSSEFWGDSD
jgi:hypothetical protein